MIPTTLRTARILIVDDQPTNVALLEDLLQAHGYTHLCSLTDPRQVLATYAEFQPDLILLDLLMPYLDGVEVLEQLRPRVPGESYLPVLVMTADVTSEARKRSLRAGAKDFITKPFDEDEVLLRIKNLLETRFLYLEQQFRAADALRESEELLEELTENLPVVLWVTTPNARQVLYVNSAYEQVWSHPRARLAENGRAWIETIHADDRAATLEQMEKLVRGERVTMTYRIEPPNQPLRFVEDHRFPIQDANGTVRRLVGYVTDVTEKKGLEAQVMQAQKMEAFGRLAAGVAHDFNNLLTVISGFGEMLMAQLGKDESKRTLLHEICLAGERAASLTRQMLAFSRQQILEPVVLDLNALVSDTDKMLRRLIGEDIQLVTVLAPNLSSVKVDPGQMDQVIMNLAVNARDAMPQGGTLTLETQNVTLDEVYARSHGDIQPGPHVLLAVTDTGCGMSPAVKARLFEPFFTTKGVGKGTGLGMAVVHGIIKQSGGSIEVYSELGVGTTFHIYLPAVAAAAQPLSNPRLAKPGIGKETILYVEDEEVVRKLGSLALQRCGYTVLKAKGGPDALRILDEENPKIDLLLTDVVMPQMSGPQLAEILQARVPGLKVLFLSGYMDDAVVRHGILETNVAFLQKPFTPISLARKVRDVLDMPCGASGAPLARFSPEQR